MTCETYRALLDELLDGVISPEDEKKLLQHEKECPDCAELHASLLALQEDLSGLADNVPPLPEGFHEGWTQKLEDTPMEEKKNRTPRFPAPFRRTLAACAAIVVLVGGTLLTRDQISPRQKSSQSSMHEEAIDMVRTETTAYGSVSSNMALMAAAPMEEYSEAEEALAFDDDVEEPAPAVSSELKIIRTASLTLATKSFDETLAQLQTLCESSGGWTAYSSAYAGSNGLRRASLTFRIPADVYEEFLASARGIARITRSEETAEDMTASYRDTSMRLDTQLALMDRLQAMVTETASLSDLLDLESQIAQVQYQIDSLRSSLKQIDNSVDYSTVSISVNEEKLSDDVSNTTLSFPERLSSALQSGWNAFIDFMEDMAVFVIHALPFLLLLVIVILVLRLLLKKKKGRRP